MHPIETLKVGSIGTLHALGLAKEKGARFLLASTSEAYGDPQVHPQPETYWGHVNPVGPRGVYDEAKRYAEALTMAYRRTHDVDTAIVRIFNTHDPRMRPNDGRAIPAFTTQALLGKPITVAGDGSQTRSIVYVTDLVEGIIQLLRSDLAGPVNIGNPHETSVLHIAEAIRRLVGSDSDIIYVPRPIDDPNVHQSDISQARRALGWEPRIGFVEGLSRTVEWFRAPPGPRTGMTASAGSSPRFVEPDRPAHGHVHRPEAGSRVRKVVSDALEDTIPCRVVSSVMSRCLDVAISVSAPPGRRSAVLGGEDLWPKADFGTRRFRLRRGEALPCRRRGSSRPGSGAEPSGQAGPGVI